MKKKVLALLLTVSMFVCACSGSSDKSVTNENVTQNIESSQVVVEETEEKEVKEDIVEKVDTSLVSNIYKIPLEDIYVNVPDWKSLENGFVQYFTDTNEDYGMAFVCEQIEKAETIRDAFDLTWGIVYDATPYIADIKHVNEVTEEYIKIDDMDVLHFEGTAVCGDSPYIDAYINGYVFIFNDYPCMLFGLSNHPEKDVDYAEQDSIVKEASEMSICTVRTEAELTELNVVSKSDLIVDNSITNNKKWNDVTPLLSEEKIQPIDFSTLDTFKFVINGNDIVIDSPFSRMYEVTDYQIDPWDDDKMISWYDDSYVYYEKEEFGADYMIYLYNHSNEKALYSTCNIMGFGQNTDATYNSVLSAEDERIIFPGNLSVGQTIAVDELIEVFGKPMQMYNNSRSTAYTKDVLRWDINWGGKEVDVNITIRDGIIYDISMYRDV